MGLAPGPDAWILSIGNELLIGRVVNTNMAWLGRKLTLLGYRVRGGLIVPDSVQDIAWAFRTVTNRGARVVVSTGGLGPTFDDKTSEGLAKAMEVELVVDERALEMIRRKYGGALTEHRVKMARIPRGGKPIPNPLGTAPGVEVEWRGATIFLLPGVPVEMKAMFESYVEPRLRELESRPYLSEAFLKVLGLPESELAPVLDRAMKLSDAIYIKSHPRGPELGVHTVELHITASGRSVEEAEKELRKALAFLEEKLRERGARVASLSTVG
ncbi:MAG TPA: nicotinamide mononucleotide deamidase-related protein [Thermofilaceae archaeon]|nr:nicotinamide mononucleotide deamidase-related protein [Thermofilaceae archaeon]